METLDILYQHIRDVKDTVDAIEKEVASNGKRLVRMEESIKIRTALLSSLVALATSIGAWIVAHIGVK